MDSAILDPLKRKQGKAALTIFVKPKNGGSQVMMMTEGLA